MSGLTANQILEMEKQQVILACPTAWCREIPPEKTKTGRTRYEIFLDGNITKRCISHSFVSELMAWHWAKMVIDKKMLDTLAR